MFYDLFNESTELFFNMVFFYLTLIIWYCKWIGCLGEYFK